MWTWLCTILLATRALADPIALQHTSDLATTAVPVEAALLESRQLGNFLYTVNVTIHGTATCQSPNGFYMPPASFDALVVTNHFGSSEPQVYVQGKKIFDDVRCTDYRYSPGSRWKPAYTWIEMTMYIKNVEQYHQAEWPKRFEDCCSVDWSASIQIDLGERTHEIVGETTERFCYPDGQAQYTENCHAPYPHPMNFRCESNSAWLPTDSGVMLLYPGTAALASFLGAHGYRKGSLSTSGAIAAALLGYITLANQLRTFGVLLIVFYLSGSRATKTKAAVKAKLEDQHGPASTAKATTSLAGNRDAVQVLCNGLVGALASLSWQIAFVQPSEAMPFASWLSDLSSITTNSLPAGICPSQSYRYGGSAHSRAYLWTAIAFFSACMGDTLASELGMLARTKPRLVTTFQPVPPGTNGGITPFGLLVSLLGGTWIGIVTIVALSVESHTCYTLWTQAKGGFAFAAEIVILASLAGLFGSLLDSLLGATMQETLYSKRRSKIVHSRSSKDEVVRIAGTPLLSNNAVNFVACMQQGVQSRLPITS
ncbi:hypothetical protein E5Q_06090 [Mixia osmundae IAM 14324]|uniref:Uncharacterized protein n=1 Tax=Mixia osmundae (strain CBS 9802 / IAM 14324 / JCM 22182 / KY 12970) TaxID=764103 RepID=G7E9S4_MIXOS|nr:hypothetical protein E5Q_06090 [Mixia osmundae IAM 14324]